MKWQVAALAVGSFFHKIKENAWFSYEKRWISVVTFVGMRYEETHRNGINVKPMWCELCTVYVNKRPEHAYGKSCQKKTQRSKRE